MLQFYLNALSRHFLFFEEDWEYHDHHPPLRTSWLVRAPAAIRTVHYWNGLSSAYFIRRTLTHTHTHKHTHHFTIAIRGKTTTTYYRTNGYTPAAGFPCSKKLGWPCHFYCCILVLWEKKGIRMQRRKHTASELGVLSLCAMWVRDILQRVTFKERIATLHHIGAWMAGIQSSKLSLSLSLSLSLH